MGKLVLISLLSSCVVFTAPFAFIGLDITGHLIPFVGVGLNAGDDYIMASLGVVYDSTEDTWGFEQSVRYFHMFGSFKIGLNFTTIGVTAEPSFLYILGPEIGYSFKTGYGTLDLGASVMMTLPFGATSEIEGPIPFLNLIWRFDRLP